MTTTFQTTHEETLFTKRKFEIILVCDGPLSPANIGSLFRTADCFGISCIYFTGITALELTPRLKKAARSTYQKIPYNCIESTEVLLKNALYQEYQWFCLEITKESIPLSSIQILDKHKIVVVIGNEQSGISSKTLSLIPHHIHINMFGLNSSMNVVNATNIALYHFTQQLINTKL